MPAPRLLPALAALAAVLPVLAAAQDRPSEDELFGAPKKEAPAATPAPEAKPAPPPAAPPASGGAARPEEADLFGAPAATAAAQPPPDEGLVAAARRLEDPLKIGGQIYLRAVTEWQEGQAPRDWYFASPNLLDLFADVRPNERVRGFVLGRLSYDPTLASGQASIASTSPGLYLGGSTATTLSNPHAILDQLWLNFDVADRRAFLTAGRQHVKWGVGTFWNPTDYLHPVKRDPLAIYDVRPGTSLVKLHIPWEKRGWNLYGVAVLEDLAGDTTQGVSRLGRIGGGGRAEIVLGTAELGLDALVQDGHHPRFGVDLSGGLGDLDLYAEAALRDGIDGTHWAMGSSPSDLAGYHRDDPTGFTPQVTLGGSWSVKYSDEDSLTVGAEYFYNAAGYADAHIYPFLLYGAPALAPTVPPSLVQQDPTAYHPFYLGKHYAGAYLNLPNPGSWNNTTFTLSVLGNLSDKSFIARLDHSVLILTYLRIETFVAGHLGTEGGEFRLGFTVPPGLAAYLPPGVPSSLAAPVLDLGIAARVSL